MKNFGLFLGILLVWGLLPCSTILKGQTIPKSKVSGTFFEENANFRVNYKVMSGDSNEVISSGKTIFCDGNAYDFVDNTDEIIVLNSSSRKIYVLDVENRKKWTTTPEEVEEYATKLCRWGMSHPKEEIRQYFQPDFKRNYDEAKDEYSFIAPTFSYFVTPAKPEKAEFLQQYRYFAQWSCRTNMMLSPGAKTLYPRYVVNEVIFNAGSLIEKVQLSIKLGKGPFAKQETLLSEYQYLSRLVESDQVIIRQVEDYLVLFRDGTLEELQNKRLGKEPKETKESKNGKTHEKKD